MVKSEGPVLVVDDEPEVRAVVREYLTLAGREVLEAGNGLEALWVVKHQRPPVVLLDLSMPRLGGLETIRHIRKFDPSIQVVVVTGQLSPDAAARLDELGVSVIAKPLPLTALDGLLV
jgi:CheY-like chemotaxis protein